MGVRVSATLPERATGAGVGRAGGRASCRKAAPGVPEPLKPAISTPKPPKAACPLPGRRQGCRWEGARLRHGRKKPPNKLLNFNETMQKATEIILKFNEPVLLASQKNRTTVKARLLKGA